MTKIIALNGPPRCGKDTAATAIAAHYASAGCGHMKLSFPLKQIVTNVVGHDSARLETSKELLIPGWASSFRDYQIHTYEALARVFGTGWLAHDLINRINRSDNEMVVLSDCGRAEELGILIREYGAANVMVIQILRDGCTFDYDIRTYVSDARCVTRVVANRELQSFQEQVIDIAGEFYASF